MVMVHGLDNDSLCFYCARLKTLLTIGPFFFVSHFTFMQICTECPVLKKVEIILFFVSEKLKK